jgi:hypothetical protein
MRRSEMITIWKYPLAIWGEVQKIEMPIGARVLCVQLQDERPFLWAVVDDEAPAETRAFIMHGTGHQLMPGEYIGTIQLHGFVWHYFSIEEKQSPTRNEHSLLSSSATQ